MRDRVYVNMNNWGPLGMLRAKLPGMLIALSAVFGSVLLLAGVSLAGAVVWVVGYGLLLIRQYLALRDSKWVGRLNSQIATRISFSFGIAAVILAGESAGAVYAWAALVLTIFLVRFAGGIQEFSRGLGFQVANLSGVVYPALPRHNFLILTCALLLLPPMLFVLGALEVHGAVGLTFAAAVACSAVLSALRALKRRERGDAVYDALPEEITKHNPAFMLYWSAPPGSQYQLSMWLPYLKRLNLPFFIMVRSEGCFDEAVEVAGEMPVVWARTLRDVERLITDSLTTVFYVNNSERNNHVVRFSNLKHIQLLHGDSEKTPSYNPVTAMFDRIYVAGQAAVDRYAAHGVSVPAEKFEIVGRPQVELVERERSPIAARHEPCVLYAPTWTGFYQDTSYSSLLKVAPFISVLLERGCRVVFRPHPYSRRDPALGAAIDGLYAMLEEHRAKTGVQHIFGEKAEQEMTISECFNASDAMVADVSSVVSDFLYSGKPLGLFTGAASSEELLKELPLAGAAYIFGDNPDSWVETVDELLSTDPLRESRQHMRDYYLGAFPEAGYSEVFLRAAKADILTPKPTVL